MDFVLNSLLWSVSARWPDLIAIESDLMPVVVD